MSKRPGSSARHDRLLLALILLWAAGASLRLTVLALPPVLNAVTSTFHLKPTDVGVLTATPAFFFAAAAIPGALLVGRIGAAPCLVVGLGITAAGAAARGFANGTPVLEATTAVMCLGIALAQPALPTLIRDWAPRRVGLASATYTFGLLFGEIAPVIWPLRAPLGGLGAGWRMQLLGWSLPVLITTVALAALRPRSGRTGPQPAYAPWPAWSHRAVWWNGLLMGAVGATYFSLNGFIPGWLAHIGLGAEVPATLAVLNLAQLPAALVMMAAAEALVFRAPVYVAAGLAVLASTVVLATGGGASALAAAGVAGFCLAVLLALVITQQPLIADEETLPALSAGAFTIGFGLAVIVALLTGWLSRLDAGLLSVAPIAAACALVVGFGGTIGMLRDDQAQADASPRR